MGKQNIIIHTHARAHVHTRTCAHAHTHTHTHVHTRTIKGKIFPLTDSKVGLEPVTLSDSAHLCKPIF